MSTRKTRGLPARLEGLRRRFERWRETHRSRSRIPERLWGAAVKMAGRYGLNRTAKTLRLDYYALKKRAEQGATSDSLFAAMPAGVAEGSDVTRFVELASPAAACECSLEWEDAGGAKMRVHLKGASMPDLAALSRSFWNPGP